MTILNQKGDTFSILGDGMSIQIWGRHYSRVDGIEYDEWRFDLVDDEGDVAVLLGKYYSKDERNNVRHSLMEAFNYDEPFFMMPQAEYIPDMEETE